MEVWKMIFLFNWLIFRFHVNFPGCNYFPGIIKNSMPTVDLKNWGQEVSPRSEPVGFGGLGMGKKRPLNLVVVEKSTPGRETNT